MSTDTEVALIVLTGVYMCGYGHGAWMAYTTPARFRRWAETVCGQAYDRVMDAYQKGAAK